MTPVVLGADKDWGIRILLRRNDFARHRGCRWHLPDARGAGGRAASDREGIRAGPRPGAGG
ncbi:hypothetical protein NUM3379_12320 [Kineococcus sp. NUM-3379]